MGHNIVAIGTAIFKVFQKVSYRKLGFHRADFFRCSETDEEEVEKTPSLNTNRAS